MGVSTLNQTSERGRRDAIGRNAARAGLGGKTWGTVQEKEKEEGRHPKFFSFGYSGGQIDF